jgi:hypothetical protein
MERVVNVQFTTALRALRGELFARASAMGNRYLVFVVVRDTSLGCCVPGAIANLEPTREGALNH